jgi:AAA family ATP:ADP antiporter
MSPAHDDRSRTDGSFWRRMIDLRAGEGRALAWSCLYAFAVLASYYLLRPVREQAGLAYGKERLSQLYLGTLIGTLVAAPVFAWIVTHWSRRRFVPWVNHFFAANLVVFFLACRALPDEAAKPGWGVFYSWLRVFNLFVVSVQWSLMADLWSHEQAKRLFAPIAVGGSLGAVVGSYLTSELAKSLGPVPMLLGSVVFLELAVFAVTRLSRLFGDEPVAQARTGPEPVRLEDAERGTMWSGIALVFRSPYLLLICGYMVLQSFVQTFMYFEQAYIVEHAIQDRAAQTALFGRIDFWVNVITVVVQLFLTGRIVKTFGITAALLLQPLFSTLALVWLGYAPALGVLVALQVLLRSVHYATARPAREMLFTVVGRDAKYKSKNFLDTFVYRGGDAIGAQIVDQYKEHGWSILLALPFAVVWVGLSAALGRNQVRIARERSAGPARTEVEPVA